MPTPFITNDINKIFTDSIRQLNTDLSRRHRLEVELRTTVPCPNCIVDATSGESTGTYKMGGPQPFDGKVCPMCETKGKLVTIKRRPVIANVRVGTDKPANDIPMPQGFLALGQGRIKVNKENVSILTKASAFFIDGTRYKAVGPVNPRGLLNVIGGALVVEKDE